MLEKIQGSWRKRIGQTKTVLGEKVREALTSVLPITLIVLILCFTIAPVPSDVLLAFLVGAVLLIVGMGLFTLGADTAMLPIGERVGAQMTKSRKLWVVILVSFLIGMIVTISEPDLQVLAGQVPGIPNAVLIGAVVVILYTSAGGLLAVAWTDFVQGMLMIFAVIVGLFVAFGNTGSLGFVMDEITAINPALASPWTNPITIVGLLSAGWLGYMGQPQIVQMFMGMKDPGSSKRGAVIAGTTGVFLLFGSFLVNLCCIVLFPGSENPSTNFIQLITQYTPHWLVGIVTAAILAAVMSSADALLHVATTAVTQDFYNKMLKKGQATDKEVLLVARIAAVLIGAFAIYIAFNPFDSILWVNWWAWGGLSVFAPILILGFYWKRATREGAMVSMIVGFIAVYAWYKAGLNTLLHYTFVAFTVTAVVHVVVSLLTPAPPARIQSMVEELNRKD